MKLKSKVAIVTGAGQGIGKAIALELAKEGAKVVVSDINQEHIDEAVKEIKKLGSDAIGIKADVSNSSEVGNMVKKTLEQFKTIDILVNNAGIYPFKPLTEITEDDWDKVLDVNLKGIFYCTKAVIQKMINQKSGNIINIASIDGAVVGGVIGFMGLVHYASSKGGVLGFTRAAAAELAQYGVRVNAIAPGAIETPTTKTLIEKAPGAKEAMDKFIQFVPLKRMGKPEDIAKVAAFLASDDSSYITGQLIVVDGGYTLH